MLAKRSRLAIAIILVIGVSIALFASLSRNQITYFYTVAEVLQDKENFLLKPKKSNEISHTRQKKSF